MAARPNSEQERRRVLLRPLFDYLEKHRTPLFWFAEQMGMSQRWQIYRLKRGEAKIPDRFVERACAVLEVRPEQIGFYPLAKAPSRRKAS